MPRPNRSREKVLDAAAALAAERGVTATTVDDIAQRAGVAKGSVYYSFPSKDAVFEAVLADAVERTGTRLGEALAAAPAGSALRAIDRGCPVCWAGELASGVASTGLTRDRGKGFAGDRD